MAHTNLRQSLRKQLYTQFHQGQIYNSRDKWKHSGDSTWQNDQLIFAQGSLKTNLAKINVFSRWAKKKGIKVPSDITREVVAKYILEREHEGFSAWTISSDLLALNHILYGFGIQKTPEDRLTKEGIAKMVLLGKVLPVGNTYRPSARLNKNITNNRGYTFQQWLDQNPKTEQKYGLLILLERTFGFRASEIIGRDSYYDRGVTPSSFAYDTNHHLVALIIGKGGRFRIALARPDLEDKLLVDYQEIGDYASQNPLSPVSLSGNYKAQLSASLRKDLHLFDDIRNTGIPFHRARAEYAQVMLQWFDLIYPLRKWSRRDFTETVRVTNGWVASEKAFLAVSNSLGHNRIDVIKSYLPNADDKKYAHSANVRLATPEIPLKDLLKNYNYEAK